MRIKIYTETMRQAVAACCKVTPRSHPKEILTGIKLIVDGDDASLFSTDLEMAITIGLDDVEVTEPGCVVLPGHFVHRILGMISEEDTSLEMEDHVLTIQAGRDHWKLPTMDPDEYPSMQPIDTECEVAMSGEGFGRMVNLTSFVCEMESSRFALGGVLLTHDADQFFAIGTDGRRLSVSDSKPTMKGMEDWSDKTCIVPQRAVQLMATQAGDEVTLRRTMNNMQMTTAGITIVTRLVEGRYPDWTQVIPNLDDYEFVDIPSGTLASACRKVAVNTDRESRGIDIEIAEGVCHLESVTELGKSESEFPVAYEGKPVLMTLDNTFVIQVCSKFDPDALLRVYFKSHDAPVMLEADSFRHVIMPMANERAQRRDQEQNAEEAAEDVTATEEYEDAEA